MIRKTAFALVALIVTGCSSAPAETGTMPSSTLSQAVRFSACMREHGIRAFPDPDASGELTIDGVLNGSSLDPDGPAWKRAVSACKDLQPSGFTGRKRTADEQEPALAFAQCIRDHGVKDFPDPTADGPLVDTNRIPSSGTDAGMNILNAAMQQCRDSAEQAMGER